MEGKFGFIVTFGGIFCGMGLLFALIALGIRGSIKSKTRRCTAETTGTIVDLKHHVSGSAGHHQSSYHPIIQYHTADGKAIVKESAFGGSKSRYKIGQSVRVFYDPNSTDVFYLPDDKIAKIVTLVFSLVGIGMILVGAVTSILVYIFA